MSGRLEGKVAVITGTGGGQGRAAAVRFAGEGAAIVGCDLKEKGNLETVQLVTAAGGRMTGVAPLDLTDESDVKRLFAEAEAAYGSFDILYNNAAAIRVGSIEDASREDFDYTLTNEVTIVFLAIKHAVPYFRARGAGCIVNIGSIAASVGAGLPGNLPGALAHGASKAAVVRMTQQLAVELSPLNVRVNAISPGIILTPATEPVIGDGTNAISQEYLKSILIKRIGRPDDIVNAAVFLASDEASYVTGVNLFVDGGWNACGGVGQPSIATQEAMAQSMPEFQSDWYQRGDAPANASG